MKSIESSVSNDFDELLNALVTGAGNSYVLRGFNINMTGAVGSAASGLQMLVADSALLHGNSNESGTFFLVPQGEAPQILNSVTNTKVVGSFTPGAENYVSLELVRQVDDTTSGQVYIWNPANKNETTKNIPLAITLDFRIVIGTTIPASNLLPVAKVTTDLSNNVVDVTNQKPSLFSLGRGGSGSPDPTYTYPWTDGREPNAVTSTSSLIDPFKGGDLQIGALKEWMDAVMSRFKEIFGTPYWTSANASGSLTSLRQDLANTIFTGRGTVTHSDVTAGQINWSNDLSAVVIGSDIKYVISANPATTDIVLADNDVAYINLVRDIEITPNLIFTNSSQIVTSVGAIPWTSNLQAGDFVKVGVASPSFYYEILSVDSPTQVTLVEVYDEADTGATGIKSQYAFGVYETNPSPSTDRHIYIAQRDQVPVNENSYWVLLRQDNGGSVPRVYARFIGKELEQGETQDVNDGTPQAVLDYIGAFSESDSDPDYGQAYTPLVAEVTTLTAPAAADVTSGQRANLNSSNDIKNYYIWFNKDAAGGDPTPSGLIGIEVTISTGDNQLVVAAAMQAAINAISDFNAVDNLNGTVTITNDDAGATTNAANVDVGGAFAVSIDTEGTGDLNRYLIDGDSLTKGVKTLDKALGQLSDVVYSIPWKSTVINFSALPVSGNSDGDVRLVLDTRVAYYWKESDNSWLPLVSNSNLKIIGGGTISVNGNIGVNEISAQQTINTDNYALTNGTQSGSSFISNTNGDISSLSVKIDIGIATTGTWIAHIYNTDGSKIPIGSPISTSIETFTEADMNPSGNPTDLTFTFPTGTPLVLAQEYAWSIEFTGNASSFLISSNTNNYIDGENITYNGSWSLDLTNNRSLYFIIQTIANSSVDLEFTNNMYIEKIGLDYTDNTILTAESPIKFYNDKDVAYVIPNLTTGGPNLSVNVTELSLVPFTGLIIARRDGNDIIVGSSSTRLKINESIDGLYASETDQTKDKIRGVDLGIFECENKITWDGNNIIFTDDIVFTTFNKNGTKQIYTVNVADSPITLANGEYAYLLIDRTVNSDTLSFIISTSIPAIPNPGIDLIVFAQRKDTSSSSLLNLIHNKQTIEEGKNVRIGASGSGSESIKATFLDPVNAVLPTGTSVTIDGVTAVDGDTVLFTNLTVGNNRIYELSGVGVSLTWTALRSFDGSFDPNNGDTVRVLKGNGFKEQLAVFNNVNFLVNDYVRYFDGVSGDYFEQSSIKTSTLIDNTTDNLIVVSYLGSENMIIDYSILRGTAKETGQLFITTNGIDARVARQNSFIGNVEVEFNAIINAGNIEISYTTSNLSTNATMKYAVKRWSNSSGGPSGIPNYATSTGSSVAAAGNVGEIQFNGSSGNLDSDSRFSWNTSDGSLNLNNMKILSLKGPFTLNDNQTTPLALVNYPTSSYNFSILEYSIKRGADYRVGRLLISNSSSTVNISDDFIDTGATGVVFSAIINAGNVEIRYITTSTGQTGEFKYTIKQWSE
jgi:hypothetical protein